MAITKVSLFGLLQILNPNPMGHNRGTGDSHIVSQTKSDRYEDGVDGMKRNDRDDLGIESNAVGPSSRTQFEEEFSKRDNNVNQI